LRTISLPAGRQASLPVSKGLLALRADQQLVEQVRLGTSEAAFEAIYERYGAQILSFCRHMLGSREEAEDAVQHTFAAAYTNLLQNNRQIHLRPWLYAIARNRCLSTLRARREETSEERDIPTAGLAEEVEQRAELRQLLADLRELPDEQRAAILMAEAGDLSHPEIADALECEVPKVKALVFRARSGLMERRQARETPCEEIREQLANLRGGALRRSEIRHHLRHCRGCTSYREDVKRQRQMIAAILPVAPTLGLKSSVMAAAGIGGGSAGGGIGIGLTAATVGKIAAVAAVAGGGIVAGDALIGGSEERAEGAGGVAGERSERESGRDTGRGRGRRRSAAGGDGPGARVPGRRESRTRVLGKEQHSGRPPKDDGRSPAPGGAPGGAKQAPPNAGEPKKPKRPKNPKTDKGASQGIGHGKPEAAPPPSPPVRRRPNADSPPPGQTKPRHEGKGDGDHDDDDDDHDA
jgi:RNA polymerase sigma factor (sigma-70 family)